MPCPLPALLTPRGSVTFRTTIRPRNLHPLKATQSPICTTQSRRWRVTNPKGEIHIPSRRRQRHERLRGKPVAKREMQQFQGILSSRVPHPHPWHDHPRSPFMFVGHSSDLLRAVPAPPRLPHRGERTKVEAHTNMHFFVRLLEVSPCSPRAPRIGSGVPVTPVAEHVQGTTLGDLRSEPMKKPDLYVDPVLNFELLPLLGLGRVE